MQFVSPKAIRVLVMCAASTWLLTTTTGAQRHDPPGLEISNEVHYDLSQRLASITPLPRGGGPARMHPIGELPEVPGTTGNPDTAVQTSTGVLAPGFSSGFEGIGVPNYSVNAAPPDTNGAVGPNHYVQWVNEAFAIFNKATGHMDYGPAAGNTLWSGFGGLCETHNDGDPIVLYDHLAGRWVFSQFAISSSQYLQCIAISQTSDPMGAYYRYSFAYTYLNDYPKFGVWPDAYYATHNMFQQTIFGWSFKGSKVCAYDRSRMLQGQSATQQCFTTSTSYGGLLPSDLDGAARPPAGAPNYLLNFGSNKLNLWKFHVDWSTPANSTFSGPISIPVASFSTACNGGTCIPQPETSQQLDSLGDRLMYRLAYRNFGDHESLVVNHSVTAGSVVGIRWYELRNPGGATPTVYQQGTFAPDATYRWMGSMAMDQIGDIAVGYSASSSVIKPGIRYTGRGPGDTLGTLQVETTVLSGGGSQLSTLNRWGDYSSMSIDPVDDCTFWYTNEYLNTNGTFNWSTWIVAFKFPLCGNAGTAPAAPTDLVATVTNSDVGLSWTASADAASYNVLRSTTSGSGYAVIASGITTTNYTDLGLANGTYYYVVQAVNSGTSPNSNEASATICVAPAAPTGLTAVAGSEQVSLHWSAVPGVTYNVKRWDGAVYSTIASGLTTPSYTDTGLTNGATYSYVVSATSCLESTDSIAVSATPEAGGVAVPPAPTGLVASQGPGAKKISLSWIASSGATSYNVKRSTISGGPYITIATAVTTTYSNTGLSSGTTYYYVVSAVNSAGESPDSNPASNTTR
jgi:fibronectin type 3 domain-containing protein